MDKDTILKLIYWHEDKVNATYAQRDMQRRRKNDPDWDDRTYGLIVGEHLDAINYLKSHI